MIELHEVGDLVDPLPGDRLATLLIAAQLLDFGARRLHHPVAAETEVDCGHRRPGRLVRVGMAIEAVDLVFAGVAPVTEEDRLNGTLIPADQRVGVE